MKTLTRKEIYQRLLISSPLLLFVWGIYYLALTWNLSSAVIVFSSIISIVVTIGIGILVLIAPKE
jgi:hypothetical protein